MRIGETVPRFVARSTQGLLDLADYDDRWFILFAHPADFTPVCTSEFIALARAEAEFEALDCALIGLSVDSLYSHFAWLQAIHRLSGEKVTFPIIEDPTMEVARAYGMVGEEAQDATSVRTVCFVAPGGVLRAQMSYPAEIGRSVPELLRVIKALQAADRTGALVPANWQQGEPMLQPPTGMEQDLFAANPEGEAWFYRFVDGEDDA